MESEKKNGPCVFNPAETWDKDRHKNFSKLRTKRIALENAKKKLEDGDPKRGKWYWAAEIQQLQKDISVLMDEFKLKLVD